MNEFVGMISVMIWIGCAVGAANICKEKGRSQAWGYISAILVGPLAILIAWILPHKSEV